MNLGKIRDSLTSEINPNLVNNNETKLASVLIIIFAESPKILMIKKPITMNHHGGEIAFPGGKISDEDNDLLDTALRETKEETGITVEREKIIGQLEPVTTLNSGFTILPFVCILDKIENLMPNSEVDEFLEIPLITFLETLANDSDPEHNSIQEMYTFTFEDHLIWGASARMLKQITTKLK
ncbi:coenzyme A pyrophosphatase [Candidatus Nitrosopelagicus brevis]|uniref:Coenzyme A pyrophosphatase n=1 Tax=Candidatus Nitrosopelagicus brevis TaxID=1410606 RepID=A0A0A7V5R6_9ARCH|nr:CoA pyrophosphatase [Candidatus Nitrosopelagicus brevis]AJA92025.1 NUDIX domain protein [Candidatus Nitrosopelagicus brevis]NMI83572.1 CoA pyrophosphatase [Candidatus Nitrosopelagicus brevis]PTL88249.1 coenzyme A pyrophosphatase [Candidatus Nitrosopelagicus brevis]